MASSCALFRAPFYFLRHGETDVNRLGLVSGQTDAELNDTGRGQARAAAQLLKDRGIGAIYSSPLKRALDTAGCVAEVLKLEIVVVPELAERNWGELEGKPRALRVREATPPGGEGIEVFTRRTLSGLASISPVASPLIVAHSGTFRVLCGELRIPQPGKAVENSLPLRFVPPSSAAGQWTIVTL
jgi:broad specificity phosphatase PhoE